MTPVKTKYQGKSSKVFCMKAVQELIHFMEGTQQKGDVSAPVAAQTKSALGKVAEVFTHDEPEPTLDQLSDSDFVANIFRRHMTKFPNDLKRSSAKKYAGRVLKAAQELQRRNQDPMSYEPGFSKAELSESSAPKKKPTSTAGTSGPKSNFSGASAQAGMYETAMPLRDGLIWRANMPADLTMEEAKRIAFHVMGLARDFRPWQPFWQSGPETEPELLK